MSDVQANPLKGLRRNGAAESAASALRPPAWQLTPLARAAVLGLIALVLLLVLWAVRDVLTPFFVAIVLAYVLRPLVGRLSGPSGLPRPAAALAVFVGLLMLLTTLFVLILPSMASEARSLATALPRLVISLRRLLELQDEVTVLGLTVDVNPLAEQVTRALIGTLSSTSRHVLEGVVTTVETVLKTILSLVIAFYLLVDTGRFRRVLSRALPPTIRAELGVVVNEMDHLLAKFLVAQLVLVLIMSSVTWVALTVLGIRYALVLAIVAGFLELIPFIGPITAAVPAVLLALVIPSPFGWPPMVNAGVVAATYFVLRHAEDYFVIPHVVGRAVELHPLMAMFAAFAGLRLGGILGMFLGVPLAAVIKVLLVYLYYKLVPPWDEPTAEDPDIPATETAGPAAPALSDSRTPPETGHQDGASATATTTTAPATAASPTTPRG